MDVDSGDSETSDAQASTPSSAPQPPDVDSDADTPSTSPPAASQPLPQPPAPPAVPTSVPSAPSAGFIAEMLLHRHPQHPGLHQLHPLLQLHHPGAAAAMHRPHFAGLALKPSSLLGLHDNNNTTITNNNHTIVADKAMSTATTTTTTTTACNPPSGPRHSIDAILGLNKSAINVNFNCRPSSIGREQPATPDSACGITGGMESSGEYILHSLNFIIKIELYFLHRVFYLSPTHKTG